MALIVAGLLCIMAGLPAAVVYWRSGGVEVWLGMAVVVVGLILAALGSLYVISMKKRK